MSPRSFRSLACRSRALPVIPFNSGTRALSSSFALARFFSRSSMYCSSESPESAACGGVGTLGPSPVRVAPAGIALEPPPKVDAFRPARLWRGDSTLRQT